MYTAVYGNAYKNKNQTLFLEKTDRTKSSRPAAPTGKNNPCTHKSFTYYGPRSKQQPHRNIIQNASARAHLCLDRIEKSLVLLGEILVLGLQERLQRRLLLLPHLHQNRLSTQLQVVQQLLYQTMKINVNKTRATKRGKHAVSNCCTRWSRAIYRYSSSIPQTHIASNTKSRRGGHPRQRRWRWRHRSQAMIRNIHKKTQPSPCRIKRVSHFIDRGSSQPRGEIGRKYYW